MNKEALMKIIVLSLMKIYSKDCSIKFSKFEIKIIKIKK